MDSERHYAQLLQMQDRSSILPTRHHHWPGEPVRRQCPGCGRATFYRVGDFLTVPPGHLYASTQDGTCMTCWRAKNGKTRATVGVTLAPCRNTLTDEEIMQARVGLVQFWTSRRRRGIPTEGLHPEEIQRPGRTLLEA